MVEEGFSWIYLIFFLIPLARIIPRLVRRWQKKNATFTENQFSQSDPRIEQRQESFEKAKKQRDPSFRRVKQRDQRFQ